LPVLEKKICEKRFSPLENEGFFFPSVSENPVFTSLQRYNEPFLSFQTVFLMPNLLAVARNGVPLEPTAKSACRNAAARTADLVIPAMANATARLDGR